MTIVRAFEPRDWDIVAPYSCAPPGLDRGLLAHLHATRGPAYTLLIDHQIAACYGIAVLWRGLGEAWAILTTHGKQHPIISTLAIARALPKTMRAWNLRRVQADVSAENPSACRWVEILGFRRESTMPFFGSAGETYYRYVRFHG